MYESRIKDELGERYKKDGYYALAIVVLILVLGVWASYEASVVVAGWNSLDANMCLIP